MNYRSRKFDMSHSLAADFALDVFDAANRAFLARVSGAFGFVGTSALIILSRAKITRRTNRLFGFERTIIDRLVFLDFTV